MTTYAYRLEMTGYRASTESLPVSRLMAVIKDRLFASLDALLAFVTEFEYSSVSKTERFCFDRTSVEGSWMLTVKGYDGGAEPDYVVVFLARRIPLE